MRTPRNLNSVTLSIGISIGCLHRWDFNRMSAQMGFQSIPREPNEFWGHGVL